MSHCTPLMLVAAGVLALSACGGAASDKAGGGRPPAPTVLTLANGNGQSDELQGFADEVARRSEGTIRIRFRDSWRRGDPDYESALVRDVVAGKADLGWVGSRAWDAFGIHAFDALTAPFVIDGYALERDVLLSAIPNDMLRSVAPLGIVGLGVLPGPLRYPLSTPRPLVRPHDYAGLRVGYQRGPGSDTLRAFGAVPVVLPTSAPWRGIDAIEQQIAAIDGNRYDRSARHLTANVPLWPRPLVVFASDRTMARLSPAQRSLLRDAMRDALPAALEVTKDRERAAMTSLCRDGIEPALASDTDKAALREAVAPVIDDLRRDPQNRAALDAIEALRPGTAPAPALTCSADQAPVVAGLPDGTYTTRITPADIRTSGADRTLSPKEIADFERATFTLDLHGDAFSLSLRVAGVRPGTVIDGTFSVYRDHFVATGNNGDTVTARFSVHGTSLRFDDVKGERDLIAIFGSQPWHR